MNRRENITPAELLRQVRLLEISTRQKTKDMFSGGYQSNFKGMGITFSEVRPYQYGDDIRSIDWNVTAKTGSPHIKIFEEERELSVLLMVDVSRSTLFGAYGKTISRRITELCASLAVTAERNGDKVGLMLFSSDNESFMPAKKGKAQLLKILRELVLLEAQDQKTSLKQSLRFLRRVLKKHHLIFIISDFLDTGYVKELSLLSRKHEIIGVRTWDAFYDDLPRAGFVNTIDPESGKDVLVDFGSADRDALMKYYQNQTAFFTDAFIQARADQLTIKTEESVHKSMLAFFAKRNAKIGK